MQSAAERPTFAEVCRVLRQLLETEIEHRRCVASCTACTRHHRLTHSCTAQQAQQLHGDHAARLPTSYSSSMSASQNLHQLQQDGVAARRHEPSRAVQAHSIIPSGAVRATAQRTAQQRGPFRAAGCGRLA